MNKLLSVVIGILLVPLSALGSSQAKLIDGIFTLERAIKKERIECLITSPSYNGICRYSIITLKATPRKDIVSINIHFDLDDLGARGLTFIGLARTNESFNANAETEMLVYAVNQRYGKKEPILESEGSCFLAANQELIRCVTRDGKYESNAK